MRRMNVKRINMHNLKLHVTAMLYLVLGSGKYKAKSLNATFSTSEMFISV
jgi:hypothetical protein